MKRSRSLVRPLRGLLLSALLAGLAGLAYAAPVHAAEQPMAPVSEAAMDAFWRGDFAALERQYALYGQPGRVDREGGSELELFRIGLARVFRNPVDNVEPYLQEVDRLTLAWATDHPQSALAHAMHAKALLEHGWSYRGGGYAREVPPQAWQAFQAYLQRAANYLKQHADVALADSYGHVVLVQIGMGLGWDRAQLIAIADEGLKRNPEDVDLYFTTLDTLLPKWGGNARALDSYINHATQQTRTRFGAGMYARMYSTAAERQYGHALFEDSLADWPRMKRGFEDMLARFPDSPHGRNRYAYMACLAKDEATLAALLAKIGDAADTAAWGENPERSLEGCRRLAKESAPSK